MTCHLWCQDGMTLEDICPTTEHLGQRPVGITYAVDAARFVTVEGGELWAFDGQKMRVDTACVYEARIFGEKGELRWHHNHLGQGKASLIADAEIELAGDWTPVEIDWGDSLDRHYVLWQVFDCKSDWTRLAEARVGELWIPGQFSGPWVRLSAREYTAVGAHGNVGVVAERYLALADYAPEGIQEVSA